MPYRFSIIAMVFPLVSALSYEPTWESLDSRPLPDWFDESKLGIFIHWGVFSEIGYSADESAWLWWMWMGAKDETAVKFIADNYRPGTTYADFAAEFRARLFDPNQWANLFAASGARYVVLTSKHHEGFTLWPSNYSWNWNAGDVGPHRNLVSELATAIRSRTNLRFGLYYSLFEWFHPLYLQDKAHNFTTRFYPDAKPFPELHEIIRQYKPDVIWSDGDWEAPDTYWRSTKFLAWLYNDSPIKDTVVTNDRWGANISCHHGGFFSCVDKYNPGILQSRKWENCMTLDRNSWGYRRALASADVLTIEELLATLAATVSCGGNLLVNVGPTGDGTIPAIFQERLTQLGQWMAVNHDAVYSTRPWSHQNDTVNPNVWYTRSGSESNDSVVYAIVLKWDEGSTLTLGSPIPTEATKVQISGRTKFLKYHTMAQGGMEISLPRLQELPHPAAWAYVLKLTHLANPQRAATVIALPEAYRRTSRITSF